MQEHTPDEFHDEEIVEHSPIREIARAQEREKRRLANRPFIDHLEDAIVTKDGKPCFIPEKGTRVIIERVASLLDGSPWLDTKVYIVNLIDHETGHLGLLDEELRHNASSNFITGPTIGYRFKMPLKGNGKNTLPRRNKAEPKSSAPKDAAPKAATKDGAKERRVYSTKGIIHTRIKNLAYVPKGETKASDGMRLSMSLKGTNLNVVFPDGTSEVWSPNKDL